MVENRANPPVKKVGECGAEHVADDSPMITISVDSARKIRSGDDDQQQVSRETKANSRSATEQGATTISTASCPPLLPSDDHHEADGLANADVVQLLDDELAELEDLISLQQRKVEALQSLREQYVSGRRDVSSTPPRGDRRLSVNDGKDLARIIGSDFFQEYPSAVLERDQSDASSAQGKFEDFMVHYARIPPTDSPMLALEMLTFRVRAGAAGKKRPVKGSTTRASQSGHLTIIASLHANGMVHLHDMAGEEILRYDTGHNPENLAGATLAPTFPASTTAAPAAGTGTATTRQKTAGPTKVVGLSGDASETDPVLVTAGADGTVRVHTLTIYLRGKKIAGRSRSGPRRSNSTRPTKGGADGELVESAGDTEGTSAAQGRSRRTPDRDGDGDGNDVRDEALSHPSSPQETSMGVGVIAEFRICLGSACAGEGVAHGGVEPVVTRVAAFFSRAMERTVVVAGYSTGGVRFFDAVNGTVLSSAGGESPVTAIRRSGQSIAYSDGQNVRFASAANFEAVPERVCRGGWGTSTTAGTEGDAGSTVTAMAFDVASPRILYVGTKAGDLMAFNTRMQEADGAYRCVSAYQLPAPRPQLRPREQRIRPGGADSTLNEVRGCSALSTVRGYLLVSHDSSVSAYNTTEEARLLFTKTQQAPAVEVRKDEIGDICGERGVIPFASPWAVLSSASSAEALVVEALPCSEGLAIYKATLPYDRHTTDLSWLRGPIFLFGLVVVALSQVYTRRSGKGKSYTGARSLRRRRRRPTYDSDGFEYNPSSDDRDPVAIDAELSRMRAGLGDVTRGRRGSRGGPLKEGESVAIEHREDKGQVGLGADIQRHDEWDRESDADSSS